MAKVLNDTDALTFMLTSYGLDRISTALSNPDEDLNISKIKVGNANYEYYEPTLDDFPDPTSDLKGLIPGGEFYIVDKALLEDDVTVSFHAVIPESFQNAEIREVGLYETIDGVDYLFAVSTQQPLLKPFINLNYLISVDYYAFLKSANLATVYDQIILNPDNQLVSEEDLDKLMSTILFTENNLMDQIHDNTKIIGLNRAQQLYTKIEENKNAFGYYAEYTNYVDLLDYTDVDKVFGYWIFNYPRRITATTSIVDASVHERNLSTNQNINTYVRSYSGLMPLLEFNSPHYYYLNEELSFLNEAKTEDISFTMGFALEPLSMTADRTLLARFNSSARVFRITEKSNGSIEVGLYADSSNYFLFTSPLGVITGEAHSLVLAYNVNDMTIVAYVNGTKISLTKTITGTYTHMNASSEADATSYINNNENPVNSKIGIITVIKDLLTDEQLKALSLNLCATMGQNPCIKIY